MIAEREMSIAAADLARGLARLARRLDLPLREEKAEADGDASRASAVRRWRLGPAVITARALPARRLGGFVLPRHAITIDLTACPHTAETFMEAFAVTFRRGGG
ncbi:MAG TPA: hypothetical protein ENK13_05225 [Thermopetrobacter sp.]|nr:hypothetical protein [Thermopetrobacter sp.]